MFSTTVLEVCEEKLVEVDIMPSFSINYGSNKCLGGVVFVTANFPNFPISSVEIIFPNRTYIYLFVQYDNWIAERLSLRIVLVGSETSL